MSDTDFKVFIAYETPSGRIVGVHHGATDREYQWEPTFDTGTTVAVLRTSLPEHPLGKHYAVDVARKKLIETADEQGVGFGFGPTSGGSGRA